MSVINLSMQDIKEIMISIVASWPYNVPYRLNTFAVTQSRSDYGSDNFNKTHLDYRKKDYWVRNYSPNNDSRIPGFLTIEHPYVVEKSMLSENLENDIWITVAHNPSDTNCPQDQRLSEYQLYLQAVDDLRMVIKEMKAYMPYILTKGDVETTAWLNPQAIQHISGDYDEIKLIGRQGLSGFILNKSEPVKYSQLNLSGHGFVAATCMLRFTTCSKIDLLSFDYTYKDCESGGVVICELC